MRIAVLATGGTIASRPDDDGHLAVRDTVAELLADVPIPAGVKVVGYDVSARPSFRLTLDDMVETIRVVRARLDDGFDGVVITHGTDTLEEAAYLISQYADRDARIALTGAQRAANEPDSDAARNIADAIRVAAAPEPVGVSVVLGGVVCAAVEARKVHTSALAPFTGGPAGAIATVDGDGVFRLSAPVRGGMYADRPVPAGLPRVDLIKLVAGADGTHLRASLAAGARGIVIEAFGSGNAGEAVRDAVKEAAAQGVPVAITSRTGGGRVRPVYAGGGADLAQAGAVFAGALTGPQARVALALALAHEPAEGVSAALCAMAEGVSR